jgi:hypothetical protein
MVLKTHEDESTAESVPDGPFKWVLPEDLHSYVRLSALKFFKDSRGQVYFAVKKKRPSTEYVQPYNHLTQLSPSRYISNRFS